MRRDLDYVSMDDYRADMAEVSARGVAIIEEQRREIEALKATIWCLVMGAGGRIEVHDFLRMDLPAHMRLTWFDRAYEMDRVYLAERIVPETKVS